MKIAKKNPIDDYSVRTVLWIWFLQFVFPRILNIATYLTQYFPFSEFGKDRFFHYKNRQVRETLDLMGHGSFLSQRLFSIDYVDKDQYFIYFIGKFTGKQKEKDADVVMKRLEKKFGENHVNLREMEKRGSFQIRIPNLTE